MVYFDTKRISSLESFYESTIPELARYFENGLREEISHIIDGANESRLINLELWLHSKGFDQEDLATWLPILSKEIAFSLTNRILLIKLAEIRGIQIEPIQSFLRWIDLEDEQVVAKVHKMVSSFYMTNFKGARLYKCYEKFLTDVERKELGLYTTPDYVIRFILNFCLNFVSWKELIINSSFRILDPACGSGGFLIEAYDILFSGLAENGDLSDDKKDFSLVECLFGLDIESFPLQFAILNLLLKKQDLSLSKVNIAYGNALNDILTPGGNSCPRTSDSDLFCRDYDLVVGNPPYFLLSGQKTRGSKGRAYHTSHVPKSSLEYYRARFQSWPHDNRNANIFYLFIEQGIRVLKEGGILGFIVPDIILAGLSAWNSRRNILKTCKIRSLVILDGKVFSEGGISNIIIFLEKCRSRDARSFNFVKIIHTSPSEIKSNDERGSYSTFIDPSTEVSQQIFENNPYNVFSVNLKLETTPIFQKMIERVARGELIRLKDVCTIRRGIENLSKRKTLPYPPNKGFESHKVIAGDNIDRFRIVWKRGSFSGQYIDLSKLKNSKVKVKPLGWYLQKKIVIKRVSSSIIAAIDDRENFLTLDSVQMLWLKPEFRNEYQMETILAILNSNLINFYYKSLFSYKRLFARVQKVFLEELPIPNNIALDRQIRISNLVKKIRFGSNEDLNKATRELNQLINKLYFSDPVLLKICSGISQYPLTLRELPGLGPRAYYQLALQGIRNIKDLVGKDPLNLANKLNGINQRTIVRWQEKGKEILKLISSPFEEP
ncbi:MAG: N-6 DNA methylase [Candidatus Heimdallarchaeota archaeon]